METETLDGGRLVVARKHLALLQANGLDTFDRIMTAPERDLKRDFPGRRTSRLELRRPDGSIQAVFLKRYYPDYLSPVGRLLRRLRWPGHGDEACSEWMAFEQLAALGIPTLEAVARGQDHVAPGAVRPQGAVVCLRYWSSVCVDWRKSVGAHTSFASRGGGAGRTVSRTLSVERSSYGGDFARVGSRRVLRRRDHHRSCVS